jgi:2-keto-4-pentenoate hydratase/2-oxohepta-3-ene-1,7-dioic acid hydratase in catechol pathway
MRLVTFEVDGDPHVGSLTGDSVVDLGLEVDGTWDLRSIMSGPGLDTLVPAIELAERRLPLDAVRLLPPIPRPGKIICVGVNYGAHRKETGDATKTYPTIFSRFADTQTGAESCVRIPAVSDHLDYEGELAVIIGRPIWRASREQAMSAVAGYSAYNDFTVRDWQRHSTQWLPGKNFPKTGAFGPALVTTDDVGPVDALTITTKVNGEIRQCAQVSDLIFDIPQLVEYITQFTALAPADVIVTGTPGGVGQFMTPPRFLQDGDVVEVDIPRVGMLRNVVRREASLTGAGSDR